MANDIFAHVGDVLSFHIPVPSAPRLDDVQDFFNNQNAGLSGNVVLATSM